ncbi:hypothetical protein ABT234_12590 [Streptomyces sp. NPDC001586]|uniref:hypothetical protein n=1 Tax=unclassified Streptomyces TaxID=2593676 RepID=UPI00331E9912
MHARYFAPLLLICISLTGCGGGDNEPEASDSPPPTAEEIAYYDCLKKQGVAIVHTDYGAPREDKSKPWNEEAHKACEPMLPPRAKPQPAAPEQIAAALKESACLRAEGVSWYPDPDPVTGEIDQTKGTPEQWSALKRDHVDALKKCRTER